MKKRCLIISMVLSMLVFNSSIPVFASETVYSTDNTIISNEDLKEPDVGSEKPDSDDMSNSYYIWEHITVKYTWVEGHWERCIEIGSDGIRNAPSFDFDPYITENLPLIGEEGQCITDSFWFYMGEGLRSEKILSKLAELEYKVNKEERK